MERGRARPLSLPPATRGKGRWPPRKAEVAILCPRDGGGCEATAASLGEDREIERGRARSPFCFNLDVRSILNVGDYSVLRLSTIVERKLQIQTFTIP